LRNVIFFGRAFLRVFFPIVVPLEDREIVFSPDLPPPLEFPLLVELTMVIDSRRDWQYGHVVVFAGKSSWRNAEKHIALEQRFMVLFAIESLSKQVYFYTGGMK
jgi:hypothetical protein